MTTPGISDVLADHQLHGRGMAYGVPDRCSCGVKTYPLPGDEDVLIRRDRAFADHQAEMIAGLFTNAQLNHAATQRRINDLSTANHELLDVIDQVRTTVESWPTNTGQSGALSAVSDYRSAVTQCANAILHILRAPAPDPANVLERVRQLFVLWSEDLSAGRCPSCGMMPETDCDHGEGYHHAYSDLRNALYFPKMPTRA